MDDHRRLGVFEPRFCNSIRAVPEIRLGPGLRQTTLRVSRALMVSDGVDLGRRPGVRDEESGKDAGVLSLLRTGQMDRPKSGCRREAAQDEKGADAAGQAGTGSEEG